VWISEALVRIEKIVRKDETFFQKIKLKRKMDLAHFAF
jgi:hypothetical protein